MAAFFDGSLSTAIAQAKQHGDMLMVFIYDNDSENALKLFDSEAIVKLLRAENAGVIALKLKRNSQGGQYFAQAYTVTAVPGVYIISTRGKLVSTLHADTLSFERVCKYLIVVAQRKARMLADERTADDAMIMNKSLADSSLSVQEKKRLLQLKLQRSRERHAEQKRQEAAAKREAQQQKAAATRRRRRPPRSVGIVSTADLRAVDAMKSSVTTTVTKHAATTTTTTATAMNVASVHHHDKLMERDAAVVANIQATASVQQQRSNEFVLAVELPNAELCEFRCESCNCAVDELVAYVDGVYDNRFILQLVYPRLIFDKRDRGASFRTLGVSNRARFRVLLAAIDDTNAFGHVSTTANSSMVVDATDTGQGWWQWMRTTIQRFNPISLQPRHDDDE